MVPGFYVRGRINSTRTWDSPVQNVGTGFLATFQTRVDTLNAPSHLVAICESQQWIVLPSGHIEPIG